MQRMNEFIIDNQPKLKTFYDKMTEIAPAQDSAVELPKGLRESSLAFMHNHLYTIRNKMLTHLEGSTQTDLRSTVSTLINNLGEPPQQQKQ